MTNESGKFESFASMSQRAANVEGAPPASGGDADATVAGVAATQGDEPVSQGDSAGERGSGGEVAIPPEVALHAIEAIPDFEPSAADCLNRALQVALSLGHASFSSDHLMLALTMDQQARRQLQRVGDIGQLREAAMLRLAKMHWKFARRADQMALFPSPTSDLEEIRKAARRAAADRDQKVAINDLVNAFPMKDGRLVYGLRESSESIPAILERIENKLVPRISDFLSNFEAQIRESAERQLEAALQDFGERHLKVAVDHQRASLEEISNQFKQRHLAALEEVSKNFQERQLASLEAMGKQVQHDLETLAIVLKHFRDRLNRQERGASKDAAANSAPDAAASPGAKTDPTEPTGRL
jgi:hypothetical protein